MKSLNPLRRIQDSFSIKVFLSLICTMSILAGCFNYVFLRNQTRNYKKQILNNGSLLAQFTANAARLGIFSGDIEMLGDVFRPVLTTPGVVEVCAVDRDNRLLLRQEVSPDSSTKCLAESESAERDALFVGTHGSSKPVYLENAGMLEFWAPVRSKGQAFESDTLFFTEPESGTTADREVIGYIGVTMDRTFFREGLREIIHTNISMFMAGLILISVITFFIVRTVTRPLKQLTDRVRKQGDQTSSADELGLLAGTFDSMLLQLSEAFTVNQDLQQELRGKVEELQREIEAHSRTERARERGQRQYRTLIETIRDIVYTLDVEARITYVSPVVKELTGYSPDELLGRNFLEYICPSFRESAINQFSHSGEQGVNLSYEAEIIKKDGSTLFLEATATALFDENGKILGRIGSARDVTKRKQLEKYRQELEIKALQHAKLAALGGIAAGVAHEINQPLSYIKVIYESTLNDMELNQLNSAELKADCREALRQVARITQIVNHLRTFGRSDQEVFQPLDLRQSFNNTMILMEKKLAQNTINLSRDIAENLPPIYGSSVNMEQVLINLMQNSVNALEGRKDGRIAISMQPETEMVVIRFSDNGPGIPLEIQDRVYEPFFTTREVGKGTGLGLSIIYGIIKEHKGTIDFESAPGRGCVFSISLPIAKFPPTDEEG
jgi:PAS domain S-box-containing protein